MRWKSLTVAACLVLVIVAVAHFVFGQQLPQVIVEGTTANRAGTFVDRIGVRAVRSGETVAETRSGPEGRYRLQLPGGTPFDLVFDEAAYQPAVLVALSGRESHRIYKVMLLQGEVLDVRTQLAASFARGYLDSLPRR